MNSATEPEIMRRDCADCAYSTSGYGGFLCLFRDLATSVENRRAPDGICGPKAVFWTEKK